MTPSTQSPRRKDLDIILLASRLKVGFQTNYLKTICRVRSQQKSAVFRGNVAEKVLRIPIPSNQAETLTFNVDCTIILAWIQNPSRNSKPFVSARVGEIQINSDPSKWKYIPGGEKCR